jgi:putative Mn2+ efflux pump MntP
MNLLVVIGIAVGLAMDTFAVALGASASLGRVTGRQVFRFAFHFGLFQTMMPIVGWLAGRGLDVYIATWDHWVAFGLLAFIGSKAIVAAVRGPAAYESSPASRRDAKAPSHASAWPGPGETRRQDPTRGWTLLMLSVATSIDALAVGLTLGVLAGGKSGGVGIWLAVLIIGLVTAALTILGMHLGSRLGSLLGKRFSRVTEIVGGMVLIGIGVKILVEHVA